MIVVGRHGHAWRLMLFATVVALAGCAGSGSVSLEQARQIVAQFKGQTFTPPPRTITDLTQLLDSTRPDPARIARLRAEGDAVPPTGAGDLALARFYRQRSNAAQDLGRVEQGLADMRTAEKHAGAGGMSYQERRNILRPLAFREVAAGNYQSGLEALKTAGNIQPTTSIATAELSTQLYAAIGDLNAARGFERVASTGRNDRSSTDPFQPWRVQLARVWILHAEGRWQEAEPLLREALVTIDASQKGPVPYSPATREDWIDTTLALAENLLEQGRLVESEVLARQVLTKSLEDRGKDHPTTVRTLSLLARILAAQGRPEDSEALARAVCSLLSRIPTRGSTGGISTSPLPCL